MNTRFTGRLVVLLICKPCHLSLGADWDAISKAPPEIAVAAPATVTCATNLRADWLTITLFTKPASHPAPPCRHSGRQAP